MLSTVLSLYLLIDCEQIRKCMKIIIFIKVFTLFCLMWVWYFIVYCIFWHFVWMNEWLRLKIWDVDVLNVIYVVIFYPNFFIKIIPENNYFFKILTVCKLYQKNQHAKHYFWTMLKMRFSSLESIQICSGKVFIPF